MVKELRVLWNPISEDLPQKGESDEWVIPGASALQCCNVPFV